METFTVRDLREHIGQVIHSAEVGKLSLITKNGRPILLAVPFSEEILQLGLQQALAIKLYQENTLTLEKSAQLAGVSLEAFIEKLGSLGIVIVDYPVTELHEELKDFG